MVEVFFCESCGCKLDGDTGDTGEIHSSGFDEPPFYCSETCYDKGVYK